MKLMLVKRLLLAASLSGLIAVGAPATALAHQPETNNGVTTILHVGSGDSPTAGSSATVDLFFGDTPAGFSAYDCHCLVTINRGSHMVSSAWAQPTSAKAAIASVIFPDQGSYEVSVDGLASAETDKVFHVDYDVNAVPAAHVTSLAGNELINGVAAVIGAAIAVALALYFRSVRHRKA